MTDRDTKGGLSGEVFGPGEDGRGWPGVSLPPKQPLTRAILGRLPFWGMRKTIEAYQKAVQAGVDTQYTIAEFYKAVQAVEIERERWNNIDDLREAERRRITAELAHAKMAERQAVNALALVELQQVITQNELEARRIESELRIQRAQARLDEEGKPVAPTEPVKEELDKIFAMRKHRDDLTKYREQRIRECGGEENLTEEDRHMFEVMEDAILYHTAKRSEEG